MVLLVQNLDTMFCAWSGMIVHLNASERCRLSKIADVIEFSSACVLTSRYMQRVQSNRNFFTVGPQMRQILAVAGLATPFLGCLTVETSRVGGLQQGRFPKPQKVLV